MSGAGSITGPKGVGPEPVVGESAPADPGVGVDLTVTAGAANPLSLSADTLSLSPVLRARPFMTLTETTMPFSLGATAALDLSGDTATYPLLPTRYFVSPFESYQLLGYQPPLRQPGRDAAFERGPGLGMGIGAGGVTGVSARGGFRGFGPRIDRPAPSDLRPRTPENSEVGGPGSPERIEVDRPTVMVNGPQARREMLERQQGFYSGRPPAEDPRDDRLRQVVDEYIVELYLMPSIGARRFARAAALLGIDPEDFTDEQRRAISERALALNDRVRVYDPTLEQRFGDMKILIEHKRRDLADQEESGASPERIEEARVLIRGLEMRLEDTAEALGATPNDVYGPLIEGQMWAGEMVERTTVDDHGVVTVPGQFRTLGFEGMKQPVAEAPDGGEDEAAAYAGSLSELVIAADSSYAAGQSYPIHQLIQGGATAFTPTPPIDLAGPTGGSILGRGDVVSMVSSLSGADAATASQAVTAELERAFSAYQRSLHQQNRNLQVEQEAIDQALDALVLQVRFAVNRTLTREDTGRTPVAETPVVGQYTAS